MFNLAEIKAGCPMQTELVDAREVFRHTCHPCFEIYDVARRLRKYKPFCLWQIRYIFRQGLPVENYNIFALFKTFTITPNDLIIHRKAIDHVLVNNKEVVVFVIEYKKKKQNMCGCVAQDFNSNGHGFNKTLETKKIDMQKGMVCLYFFFLFIFVLD